MSEWIGPVDVALFEASMDWAGEASPTGFRPAEIRGLLDWSKAKQLQELVSNPHRRLTIGGESGVLEYFWLEGERYRSFRGWYLLTGWPISPQREHEFTSVVPFSLSALYLGDHLQPAIARSARARANGFGLAAKSVVAQPFWGEESGGEAFVADPGGSAGTRSYDPIVPHLSSRLTAAARSLRIQVGTVTSAGVDDLDPVVLPDLEQATDYEGASIPKWITDRGGECRAFDRRDGREVFGPSHPLVAPTDLIITNGIIRAWIGPRGLPPYLQVQALASGEWREVGYLHLADPTSAQLLTSARLVRVTPDAVTVAVGIQDQGEATVTLRQGERMFRIRHGSSRSPRVKCNRQVQWAGLPPWSHLVAAANGEGKFGKGLEAGRDTAMWNDALATWSDPGYSWDGLWVNPDLRLRWPGSLPKSAWTMVLWYKPARAAVDLNGAGLMTAFDTADAVAWKLLLDDADERFKLTIGATTIQSSVQAFAAGADVFLSLRFSTTLGMALSVKPGAGALEHVKNAAALDPGTAATYKDLFFATSDSTWGSGTWGSGNWGGVQWADGVEDNVMLFDGYLTDAELAALSVAGSRLDGLPSPEARLVWHVPGDPRPLTARSPLTDGRTFESTVSGGATRSPDDWGLTKGVGVLDATAGLTTLGLGVLAYAEEFDVGVFLATTATLDDLADHHQQFAAASEQEVRVR